MKTPELFKDLAEASTYRDVIWKYAWVDILSRFDRTVLGPLWVVVTTVLWIVTVGLVMTELFKQSLANELPYLAFGVFAWQFISTTLLEASSTFVSQKQFLGAYRLPLTFFVLRVVARNMIVLAILTVVAVPLAWYFSMLQVQMLWHAFAVLAVYVLIVVPVVTILGATGARFLDTGPMLTIVMNIMMIVTPVFWKKELLPADHYLTVYNPFIPILDLYRSLFMSGGASWTPYLQCLLLAAVLWVTAIVVFEFTSRRIRNWL